MYYKIIKDSTFIGVATSYDMRRYQAKHNLILACNEDSAEYIHCGAVLYRSDWMKPVITDKVEAVDADVFSISLEEYESLYEAIESGEDIIVEEEEPPVQDEPEYTDPIEEITVEYVKSKKLKEIANACSSAIELGFDTLLSDGVSHHFSMTIQDQMNINTIIDMAKAGIDYIPYHADGEVERNYPQEDIFTIGNASAKHRFYNISYHNSLKQYVSSLDTIEEISAVSYGMVIPKEFINSSLRDIEAGNTSFDIYTSNNVYKDTVGNKYNMIVDDNGDIHTNIIESASGELFI